MIDAAYHAWLERVRPLTVEVIAVATALVLAHVLPAAGDWSIVAVSVVAAAVVVVRSARADPAAVCGTAGVRGVLAASVVAAASTIVLALGARQLAHAPLGVWSLFQVPPPVPRTVALALVVPNALAAALVFNAWLQTRVALVAGRWVAAAACVAVYAAADRNLFAALVAIAPAVARAESGSLAACVCAYAVLGLFAVLSR